MSYCVCQTGHQLCPVGFSHEAVARSLLHYAFASFSLTRYSPLCFLFTLITVPHASSTSNKNSFGVGEAKWSGLNQTRSDMNAMNVSGVDWNGQSATPCKVCMDVNQSKKHAALELEGKPIGRPCTQRSAVQGQIGSKSPILHVKKDICVTCSDGLQHLQRAGGGAEQPRRGGRKLPDALCDERRPLPWVLAGAEAAQREAQHVAFRRQRRRAPPLIWHCAACFELKTAFRVCK
jgi:hypothetical protein